MMNLNNSKVNKYLVFVLGLILSLFSISNAHIFGQIKKYASIKKRVDNTFNFEKEIGEFESQNKDKSILKVFSDREKNIVYLDPYAQKKGRNQDFLTPYYVLDKKNNYLKIVQADEGILGKPKGIFSFLYRDKYHFKDIKNIKYVGWIHKNNVLAYNHPKLSRCNYKPLRYVVGVHSIKAMYNTDKYIKKDSISIFKEPSFKNKSGKKLLLNQFVFLYKRNVNKKAVLVSNLENINLKDSISRVMGWIPESLLNYVGQKQVYSIHKADSLAFSVAKNSCEYIKKKEIGGEFIYDLSKHHKRPKRAIDSLCVVLPLSVWNHDDNKLINVDGEDILISKLKDIKKENKVVHFNFIFDCGNYLNKKQLLLMSSLQKIGTLISSEKYKDYEFTFSASSYGCDKFYSLSKTTSFSTWIDYLQNIFEARESITSLNPSGIGQCFENAIKNLPKESFTNNIIIVSGEKNFLLPPNIKDITQKLGQTSSRIIFHQLENKVDKNHQDYIFQAKEILSNVSKNHSRFVRKFIIDNNLIKTENTFKSVPSEDNIYLYDSPANSTYQGGILFPKINKVLSGISFDMVLDSVFNQTIQFNKLLVGSLEYNAERLGFLRSKPSNKIKEIISRDSTYYSKSGRLPRNYMYQKYYKNKKYNTIDNPNANLGYLLSKDELQFLIDGYKSLIPDAPSVSVYSNSIKRKERNTLYRLFRKNSKIINKNLYAKILRKRNYMADLIYLKTGMPVNEDFLQQTKIKDIKSKVKLLQNTYSNDTIKKTHSDDDNDLDETLIKEPEVVIDNPDCECGKKINRSRELLLEIKSNSERISNNETKKINYLNSDFSILMNKLRLKIDVLEGILLNKNTKMYKDGNNKEYYFISNKKII